MIPRFRMLLAASVLGLVTACARAAETPAANQPAEAASAPPVQSAPAPKPAPTSRIEVPTPRIKVSRAPPDTGPSAALKAAYGALRTRDFTTASRLYDDLLRHDERSIDALLGKAAVAMHRDETDTARELYLRVLRLEPANAPAQGALLALFGRADFTSAELRLKELIGREPSAFLYQTLGSLYADQGQWQQAQHAFFQAYHLDSRNPDHAYNLAVGLEHIGQRDLAATYYRRAIELARTAHSTGFDVALAESRAARLVAAGTE